MKLHNRILTLLFLCAFGLGGTSQAQAKAVTINGVRYPILIKHKSQIDPLRQVDFANALEEYAQKKAEGKYKVVKDIGTDESTVELIIESKDFPSELIAEKLDSPIHMYFFITPKKGRVFIRAGIDKTSLTGIHKVLGIKKNMQAKRQLSEALEANMDDIISGAEALIEDNEVSQPDTPSNSPEGDVQN